MSDEKIRHSQFSAFLEKVAPERACTECGQNKWATNPEGDDAGPDPALQVGILPGAWTHRVLPVHTLYCLNCGYIKFFAAKVVEDWVEKNA